MQIHQSTVRQWCFTCITLGDPIRVILENLSATEGRITLTCHNQAWVAHWHNLQGQSLKQVLANTPIIDLAKHFFQGQQWMADLPLLSQRAATEGQKKCEKKGISPDEKTKIEDALETLESLESAGYEEVFSFSNELTLILGADWWESTPTVMTPAFAYLHSIISCVQQVAQSNLGEK